MQNIRSEQTHKILFAIPPEVHLLDISGPAHVFYEAIQYGANFELHFVTLRSEHEEQSSAGLFFSQLESFTKFKLTAHDIVFIPGLDARLIFDEQFIHSIAPFLDWVKRQKSIGTRVCSVCTGAYLLAFAGILDGKECTTHWKYLDDFRKRFPEITLHNDRLFVNIDNIYTSAGVSSGIDLALYILEEVIDPLFATKIAKEIVVYLRRAQDDPQLSVFLQYRNHIENRIHQTQDYLAQHLAQKMKIEELAKQVNMSPRNLTRLFKKTTGITVGQYIDQLRVERAIQLLTEGQKVDSVSISCGLKSSNQLRTLLKKYRSILPKEMS